MLHHLSTTPLPSPSPPPTSPINPTTSPSPLLRDVGSLNTLRLSLRSEDVASAAPPLSKGMWARRRGKGGGGRRGNEAGKEGKTRW